MAGTTNFYGISYPTSTDYVKDGATAMQTIATGFDSVVAIPTYNNQTGTSYTFVLADTGKVVTANNASAVTFTIPPQSSVTWTANTSLRVTNLGAGALSIAGGAGVTVTNSSATVAQYSSATVVRTGSDAWTVVPAGSPAGLTLITSQTITNQSTFDLTSVFSSTYRNYKILLKTSSGNTANFGIYAQLLSGSTPANGSDYYYAFMGLQTTGTVDNLSSNGTTNFIICDITSAQNGISSATFDILTPNVAEWTTFLGLSSGSHATYRMRNGGCVHALNTSYNGLRLTSFGSATFTGQVQVYGYRN